MAPTSNLLLARLRGVAATLLCALPGLSGAVSPVTTSGVLANADGYTLYTFDYDERDKSNCNVVCLGMWMPLRAAETDRPAGRLSIIVRESGERQWALDARPLYLYNGDLRPGDVNGERLGWAWHPIRAYPTPSLLDGPPRQTTPIS